MKKFFAFVGFVVVALFVFPLLFGRPLPPDSRKSSARELSRYGRYWTVEEYDSLSWSDRWLLFWSSSAVEVTVLGKKVLR